MQEEDLPATRKVVILSPSDPAALDVLAQIYLLMDSPSVARRFLMRALSADQDFAPAHLHIGVIHIMEGDKTLAYQHLNYAQNLTVEGSPTEDQARRLLETYFPKPQEGSQSTMLQYLSSI